MDEQEQGELRREASHRTFHRHWSMMSYPKSIGPRVTSVISVSGTEAVDPDLTVRGAHNVLDLLFCEKVA